MKKTKKACRTSSRRQICIREDGVIYVLERFVDNRWIVLQNISTFREQLEDQVLISGSPLRVSTYHRAPMDVKLAS